MVTAYDHPSARLASEAGVDLILVGDSAGNNVLGYPTTVPMTMDESVMLTAAVGRARPRALVIGDMPFGSFQASDAQAVRNAVRLVKAGADGVKLEGAGTMSSRVRAIVDAGIPVVGHIGLTPQSATSLGGMKAQGRTAASARKLLDAARELESAGCFAIVLESVPARVGAHVTEALSIPTIGIGAGPGCDGQVLVWHDLLGITEGAAPRFVKRYADVAGEIRRGLEAFAAEVRSGAYPSEEHEYKIAADELRAFEAELG
jgi:3-methyl-2-oxobutanoate hydroxymethyltransferase